MRLIRISTIIVISHHTVKRIPVTVRKARRRRQRHGIIRGIDLKIFHIANLRRVKKSACSADDGRRIPGPHIKRHRPGQLEGRTILTAVVSDPGPQG